MIGKIVLVLFFAGAALGYSGGAPKEVCGDMVPQHPVDPQKSEMPYKVTVDKETIASGEKVKITISGAKAFKGYMLQVRDGDTPAGSFHIAGDDKYSKTVDCSSKHTAATHKNSASKNNLVLEWSPSSKEAKTYTVYATIAEDGGVFWVRKPTAKITVK